MKNAMVNTLLRIVFGALAGVGINMVPGLPGWMKWGVVLAVIILMPPRDEAPREEADS